MNNEHNKNNIKKLNIQIHRKKRPIPATFLVLFKNATFVLTKYEPFIALTLSKHTSDVNYTPFYLLTIYLQLFKVENFGFISPFS